MIPYAIHVTAMRLWGRQLWQHLLCWFWAVRSCCCRQVWRHGGSCWPSRRKCLPALLDAFGEWHSLFCVWQELHLLLLKLLVNWQGMQTFCTGPSSRLGGDGSVGAASLHCWTHRRLLLLLQRQQRQWSKCALCSGWLAGAWDACLQLLRLRLPALQHH